MTPKLQYSVVVPTYNATAGLAELVGRLQRVFEDRLKASYEIILIDDGSTRLETKSCLEKIAAQRNVIVIQLTRNFGKPGAVMCGLAHSQGERVLTIDDDLQQRPEDIPLLVAQAHHDVVSATHGVKQHTLFQRGTSRIKRRFDRLILGQSGRFSPMKLISRPVVDGMLSVHTNHPFIPALIHQCTTDIVFVKTPHMKSVHGKSRYSFFRRFSQFSNLVVGNSNVMLRAFSIIGYSSAALSVVLLISVFVRKILGAPVSAGWSSLMIAILAVGGLNMAAIGLTGQYFIRILDVASRKPAYLVRHINQSDEIK